MNANLLNDYTDCVSHSVSELGDLFAVLKNVDSSTPVFVEVDNKLLQISEITGYRGFFPDLAFVPAFTDNAYSNLVTVSDLLKNLEDIQEYGLSIKNVGEYTVGSMTELWISLSATASNMIVTRVVMSNGSLVIIAAEDLLD